MTRAHYIWDALFCPQDRPKELPKTIASPLIIAHLTWQVSVIFNLPRFNDSNVTPCINFRWCKWSAQFHHYKAGHQIKAPIGPPLQVAHQNTLTPLGSTRNLLLSLFIAKNKDNPSNLVTYVYQPPLFEWCEVMCGSENQHQKAWKGLDYVFKNCSAFNHQHNWQDLNDHGENPRQGKN